VNFGAQKGMMGGHDAIAAGGKREARRGRAGPVSRPANATTAHMRHTRNDTPGAPISPDENTGRRGRAFTTAA
jgi:hypothetical protein